MEITSSILISKDPANLYSNFKELTSTLEKFKIQENEFLLITTISEMNFSELAGVKNINLRIFLVMIVMMVYRW